MALARQETVEELVVGNGKPVWLQVLLGFIKILFFIYDIIVYLPFHIFASPTDKLNKSRRQKAKPIVENDPGTPWRHVDAFEKRISRTFENAGTLIEVWEESVRRYTHHDCLGARDVLKVHHEKQANGRVFEKLELGDYHWNNYLQVNEKVIRTVRGLYSLGLRKKDPVVIFADTRAEWLITAFACFKGDLPIVTVYATLGEDAIEFAFKEVESTTIFTSESLIGKVEKAIKRGVNIQNVIYFETIDPEKKTQPKSKGDYRLFSFDELLLEGDTYEEEITTKVEPDDVAFIMYTSGTTGNPKGVVLTHKNIVAATAGQGAVIPIGLGDTYIGFLPLAHILEVCAEMVVLTKGTKIGYSSAGTLFDRAPKVAKGTRGDCYALRPTLMACVPAIMDRIYKAVIDEVNSNSLVFRELFKLCYERKRARYKDGYTSFLLNRLVFNRIGKLLGGDIRMVLSGGAPLNPETQRFMNICFCCPVVQGYGLTETCGGGTLADVYDLSTGTVGPPLVCLDILLREWKEAGYSPYNERPQGEVLISGDNVCNGYYKNEEQTAKDFITIDGKRWFATGDIGEFRDDGSLKIIDRKKDLLKLSHGEYISLGKVETSLLTNSHLENVCVVGRSDRDFLVALVVPNQKNLTQLAQQLDIGTSDWEKICANQEVVNALLKELTTFVQGKLERVEIPKKIHLVSEPWTPASGLLTEALKLKRKTIEVHYQEVIEELYN